jgi:aconitase A
MSEQEDDDFEEDESLAIKKHIIPRQPDKISNQNQTLFRLNVKTYKRQLRTYLLTSRFNTITWQENKEYREQHPLVGCIYCSPDPISQHIPPTSIMFILEMNNDTNAIMGVGMVRNQPIIGKYKVYHDNNYNRYVYVGKHRIDRSSMTADELDIMKVFDILCFTGNRHMKRGQGLKSFPVDMLYRCTQRLDLLQFISSMFKRRITKNV